MNRRIVTFAGASVLALVASLPAAGQQMTEAWRATGFETPESVAYDAASEMLFVSNIAGAPDAADGNGYISQLGIDGTVVEQKWVEGLNAPKGMAVADGKLYVADLAELVEIDIAGGTISNRYAAEGAMFLNDVAAAPDGRVFVSDTFGNAIFVLENGTLTKWAEDPMLLLGVNGLLVEGDRLIAVQVGDVSQGFENIKPGFAVSIDLASKEITPIGTTDPIGTLDGVEPAPGGGWYVTDYMAGKLIHLTPEGQKMDLVTLTVGTADLGVAGELVLIPLMMEGEVAAFRAAQ